MVIEVNDYIKELIVEDIRTHYSDILIKIFNRDLADRPGVSKIKTAIADVDKEIRDFYDMQFYGDDYYALRKFMSNCVRKITNGSIKYADKIKPRLIRRKVIQEYVDLVLSINVQATILDQFIYNTYMK